MRLGEFIKKKRTEKGMQQKELAKKLDISPQYMNDIEQGNRVPTDYYFLDELACLIGSSGDYICFLVGILPRDIAGRLEADKEVVEKAITNFRKEISQDNSPIVIT